MVRKIDKAVLNSIGLVVNDFQSLILHGLEPKLPTVKIRNRKEKNSIIKIAHWQKICMYSFMREGGVLREDQDRD